MKPKKIAIVVILGLFVYLSMYTWNLRTGHLDALSSYTGLDISGFVLRPGIWVGEQVSWFWNRYVYLVGLKQENDDLIRRIADLRQDNMLLAAEARSAVRLEGLLGFKPAQGWTVQGARVIAHRMGPAGALDTLAVDKGTASDLIPDMPVVTPEGVMGRVLDCGAVTSTVLLLTDANSRIAVVAEENRSPGMLSGQGYGRPLKLNYVNLNSIIEPGELLVTSGLSGIYPKGLPVARVTKVERSNISLFLTVQAEPLVDVVKQEEVLLLSPDDSVDEAPGTEADVAGDADAAN